MYYWQEMTVYLNSHKVQLKYIHSNNSCYFYWINQQNRLEIDLVKLGFTVSYNTELFYSVTESKYLSAEIVWNESQGCTVELVKALFQNPNKRPIVYVYPKERLM